MQSMHGIGRRTKYGLKCTVVRLDCILKGLELVDFADHFAAWQCGVQEHAVL